jgi:large subunit ribosomal protein L22
MEKTYISTQKFTIMSPRKVRLVVALIKKMKPIDAVEKLPFVEKRAGETLLKVIKSALANAKNQGASDTDLVFKEIQVGEGPRLKRGRAASRGRWHQYKHRMSHIRVVLQSTKPEVKEAKAGVASKTEESKPEVKVEKKGTKENGTKS